MSRLRQVLAGAALAPLVVYVRFRWLWRGVPRRPAVEARLIERSCEATRGGRG